jgi:hypothetical protein
MKKTIHPHIWYYLSLSLLLILGCILVLISGNQPRLQATAIIMTAFFYAFWGIFHHVLHHNISAKIVIEYVLIASLGISLTLLILH